MPKRRTLRAGTRGEAIIGAVIGWLVGYIVAEGLLAQLMHPLHWVTAVVVAVLVYLGVLFWYRWQYPGRRSATSSSQQRDTSTPWYRRWLPRRRGRGRPGD
jgi:uncharacterized membrane protein YfcA